MQKFLFYTITIPLAIFVIFVVLFFLYQNGENKKARLREKAAVDIEKYGGEVLQVGGAGSRIHQVTAHLLTEHGYLSPPEDWISVSFNNSGDLMHVNCKSGYVATSCKVNDADVSIEETSVCVATIEERIKNKVVIDCAKK